MLVRLTVAVWRKPRADTPHHLQSAWNSRDSRCCPRPPTQTCLHTPDRQATSAASGAADTHARMASPRRTAPTIGCSMRYASSGRRRRGSRDGRRVKATTRRQLARVPAMPGVVGAAVAARVGCWVGERVGAAQAQEESLRRDTSASYRWKHNGRLLRGTGDSSRCRVRRDD